jgi:hypothetical protein
MYAPPASKAAALLLPHTGFNAFGKHGKNKIQAQSFALQKLCGFSFSRINKYVTLIVFRTAE